MKLRLTVWSEREKSGTTWAEGLKNALSGHVGMEVDVDVGTCGEPPGHIVFIDGTTREALARVEDTLAELERAGQRKGRAVFLIVDDRTPLPQVLADGRVDDVLVHPFRTLEVIGKILHYQRILAWDEVSELSQSYGELVEQLHDDLALAERLQKSRLPTRFPDVKGFKFASRYLAGLRSGGDYFDLADAPACGQLSLLMSDSSSYGLSSAVLSVLMRVALKLTADEARSCRDTVRKIHSEVLAALKPTDQLSLFYGAVNRKDYRLRYVNMGTSCAFHSQEGAGFVQLPTTSGPITRDSGISKAEESELQLRSADRLALVSDGFVDAAGGPEGTIELLDRLRGKEQVDTVNELVFTVRSRLADPEDLPEQDCSALLVSIDKGLIRLM